MEWRVDCINNNTSMLHTACWAEAWIGTFWEGMGEKCRGLWYIVEARAEFQVWRKRGNGEDASKIRPKLFLCLRTSAATSSPILKQDAGDRLRRHPPRYLRLSKQTNKSQTQKLHFAINLDCCPPGPSLPLPHVLLSTKIPFSRKIFPIPWIMTFFNRGSSICAKKHSEHTTNCREVVIPYCKIFKKFFFILSVCSEGNKC